MKNRTKGRANTAHLVLPLRPISTNLTMAELSLQRGDVERGRIILEKRIAQGASDFKTLNLYGIALAHGRKYDNASTIFRRLLNSTRSAFPRAKASFNLGQVLFYQDLSAVGDQSVMRSQATQAGKTTLPVVRHQPYARSVEIWDEMLRRRIKHRDIIHTYLAFVCLQLGYLDNALGHLAAALSQTEGFYVAHYVLGRVFNDLFLLASEGNHHSLTEQTATFFEIEKFEVKYTEKDGRLVIERSTLLDIALQGLLDARSLSPLSPCIYLALHDLYLCAGLIDEAYEALAHAETLAPNSLSVLEAGLRFHERVRGRPESIRLLIKRIKAARRKEPMEVYHIIPSYYMF